MKYSIAIHGGAGTILKSNMTPEKEQAYSDGLKLALTQGEAVLKRGGNAMDAVCIAVEYLENNRLFNAGKGSVFNHEGSHEMDASVMYGLNHSAGAVAGITGVKNPVKLARLVMEETDHVFLIGKGAEELAKKHNLEFEPPSYFFDEFRHDQWLAIKDSSSTQLDHTENKKFGTVGAVAIDKNKNLASATSTGGMTNKKFGRVGDTPVIGSGTYASNDSCAISCTGHGEHFLRSVAAFDVACLMTYKGLTLMESIKTVLFDKLLPVGGEGGMIGIDNQGNVALVFNCEGMYRASVKEGELPYIAIYK